MRGVNESLYHVARERNGMATGYASNIPRENLPEEAVLLDEHVCTICKKRGVERDGMCAVCAKALAG